MKVTLEEFVKQFKAALNKALIQAGKSPTGKEYDASMLVLGDLVENAKKNKLTHLTGEE